MKQEDLKFTDEQKEKFCVFNCWHDNTMRGSYGHGQCVYALEVFDDEKEAKKNYLARLQEEYPEIETLKKEDEGSFNTGDYTIVMEKVSEIIRYSNLEPRSEKVGLGAITSNEFYYRVTGNYLEEEEEEE
jgi:hypothetical protein